MRTAFFASLLAIAFIAVVGDRSWAQQAPPVITGIQALRDRIAADAMIIAELNQRIYDAAKELAAVAAEREAVKKELVDAKAAKGPD